MADSTRARRLADRIREVVAGMLGSGRIKDPRLGFVTVTDVRVTGDLQHATVFYTVMGGEVQRKGTAAALASARGVIRSEVGRAVGLRLTPTVDFQLDEVPEGAGFIEDTLRAARARDAELAAAAQGAAYAGDPDPYRHDDAEADEAEAEADAAPDADAAEAADAAGIADANADAAEPGARPGAGREAPGAGV
jgi:ribosome-binding factor A